MKLNELINSQDVINEKAKEKFIEELKKEYNNIVDKVNTNRIEIEVLSLKSQQQLVRSEEKKLKVKELEKEIQQLLSELGIYKKILKLYNEFK